MMTDEWVTILDRADELAQAIIHSATVQTYFEKQERVYKDTVLVEAIRSFNKLKERYEEVQRFGRYHPDYHTVVKEVRLAKRELDTTEAIAELRLAENDVQHILDEVGYLVATAVSVAVKVDSSNPSFLQESSCSTGCGTGSSCSCS